MPTSSGRYAGLRLLTFVALALAVVAAALVMLQMGKPSYRLTLTLPNAGQLVKGDQVKVGGVPVGKITDIRLDRRQQARIGLEVTDAELTPLHRGTVATLRSTSLSGIANRYLALTPGPNDEPEIADGGGIPAEDGRAAVDLDQVLNTLDPATQRVLRTLVRRSADGFEGVAKDANRGLAALNPAIAQTAATTSELLRDQRRLEGFLVASSELVSAVASRPQDLDQLVGNARDTAAALASESDALGSAIARLPPTLRQANTTLVNLRGTVRELRPTVRAVRPVAPLLSRVLSQLPPVARQALPVVRRLRRTIDGPGEADLIAVLDRFPELERRGLPALRSAAPTLEDALPVVRDARPYTPDLIGGLFNGFGGTTAGYYDANGHYVRISFQSNPASAANTGSLLQPQGQGQEGLSGFRTGIDKRCPGAATQALPDGSSPFLDVADFPCDPEDSPR